MTERFTHRISLIPLLAVFGLSTALAGEWLGAAPQAPAEPIDVATLMSDPDARVDQQVTVAGRMTDVCTNRGCWAVFESNGEMLRIVARDHGFAIPADARGQAVAHGVLERHEISRKAAEHMIEADGADPATLEDPVSYRLVAEGVRLSR